MRSYLHVCAGPYQVLLDAEGIHEILELEDDAAAAGHRDWRGHVLTAVNGRILFGLRDAVLPPSHAGVVYSAGEEETPVMLEFDRVERLRHADEASLLPLPPVPEKAFRLFDGVLPDKGSAGVQLYHLRRPLDSAVLLERGETEMHAVPPEGEASSATAPAEPAAKARRARRKKKS